MRLGALAVAAGAGALLVLSAVVVIRAVRKRQRTQYWLARFVAMTVVAGVGLLGGPHWHFSARAFSDAKAEYQAALARFRNGGDWERPAHVRCGLPRIPHRLALAFAPSRSIKKESAAIGEHTKKRSRASSRRHTSVRPPLWLAV